MLNLRSALQLRLRGRDASPEQIQAIVDALDAAAKTIDGDPNTWTALRPHRRNFEACRGADLGVN